jgi:NifB/MoaA-like Fe-S oxidoreductase
MASEFDEENLLMNIPTTRDIQELNRTRDMLEANIDRVRQILARIEEDRERRPDVYRRGSSGWARREELIEEMEQAMNRIKRIVEKFKKKFATYLLLKDAVPVVCSVGAIGACAYTGNILSAIKIIGGAFTVVTGLVFASAMDTSVPLSVEDRMWFTDFFSFFVNTVRPKLD